MFKSRKLHSKLIPWNKGQLIGQKSQLIIREIWSIRMRLQTSDNLRDIVLSNLALDSKLRACDLLELRVSDVAHSGKVSLERLKSQPKAAGQNLRNYLLDHCAR
jgi:hypothetical protein